MIVQHSLVIAADKGKVIAGTLAYTIDLLFIFHWNILIKITIEPVNKVFQETKIEIRRYHLPDLVDESFFLLKDQGLRELAVCNTPLIGASFKVHQPKT